VEYESVPSGRGAPTVPINMILSGADGENYTEQAVQIIARNLQERVTVAEGDFPKGVESIWRNQIADESGFHRIYVAAMRSAGVPARLDEVGGTLSFGRERSGSRHRHQRSWFGPDPLSKGCDWKCEEDATIFPFLN